MTTINAKASVRLLRAGAALFLATLLAGPAAAEGTVNIYTYRQPDLIQPVLDAFTAETGIKTEVLFLDKGLEERIAAEGAEFAGRRDHDGRHLPADRRQGKGHHAAAR